MPKCGHSPVNLLDIFRTPFPQNTMFIKPRLENNRRINQKIQKTNKEKETTALNYILSRIQRLPFSLREKRPNRSFFWSVFSCILTEYSKIRTRENSVFGHF